MATKSEMQIIASQFLNRPFDALSFYDILPTDGVSLLDAPILRPVTQILGSLCVADADVAETLLDEAVLALLGARVIDATLANAAARHLSHLYAKLLSGGKRDRARRMKLQQLNFFLRDLIDRNATSSAMSMPVAGGSPWDWLVCPRGEITIFSGTNGLRWTFDGIEGSADVGYPSQLDLIDEARISVGSIFSPGASIFQDGQVIRIAYPTPIVLVFEQEGEDWAVCYNGDVLTLVDGHVLFKLGVQQVDRVRLIDGQLLIADWAAPGVISICDLASGQQRCIDVDPIILLNDICRVGDRYYAICKQQGRVFAFDASFGFVEERLSFGRGPGRLFDPITLRCYDGELHVLNWVTATRVSLPIF